MTTKKIIIVVVSIVLVLGAIVVITVAGIVGSVFYGISTSEAAGTSREFLRNSEQLKQDIGEIQDFGRFVTGNINFNNGAGNAQLSLKVYGSRQTVNATVELIYGGGKWRVTAASYHNDDGQRIDLLNPYEARAWIGTLACPLGHVSQALPSDVRRWLCPADNRQRNAEPRAVASGCRHS